MPAAPVLTDDIKRLIAGIYLQDKTQPAKQVLVGVHERLGRDDWPKLSVIQREIKRVKDKDKELGESDKIGLDSPWNLGISENYPEFTAEAIEVIIDVQKWAEREGIEQVHETVRYGITVRQALWIARLYRAVEKHIGPRPEQVWHVSWAYSAYEILCKLSGTTFDTWEFERALRRGNEEFTLLIWNVFAVDDGNAFKAQFQLQMASQPIQKREMRSVRELAQEAGRQAEKLRSEREQYQSKEGEK